MQTSLSPECEVWCIADALRHFAPSTPLHHFGKTQLRLIRRPLAYLKRFDEGTLQAIASFHIDDTKQIEIGIKASGEFVILTHEGEIDAYHEPDWASLGQLLVAEGRPLQSQDQLLLGSHLRRQWAVAKEAASSARQLSSLLGCWRKRGPHHIEACIVAALFKLAQPDAFRLLRAAGSRSVGVYNWLCVPPPLQAIRYTGLLIEPTFVAHALCNPGLTTQRLLCAVDDQEPLRSIILDAFDVDKSQVRFLNAVVGSREVSTGQFEILVRQVATLAPQLRPTAYNGAIELARIYQHRLAYPLTFLFAEPIKQALGPATVIQHLDTAARTWYRFVAERQRLGRLGLRSDENPFDVDAQSVWQDYPDFDDLDTLHPTDEEWPDMVGGADRQLRDTESADQCFIEWLLGLPCDEMVQLHLKLCRLSLRKRQAYIEHWRYALLVLLQRITALPRVVVKLVAGLSKEYGFTAVAGQTVEFITADELAAWNDDQWRLTILTCQEAFTEAANELDNCVGNATFLSSALTLSVLYVRLTNIRSGEDTLLEAELIPVESLITSDGSAHIGGVRFNLTAHLRTRNRPVSLLSKQKGQEFVNWLNHQFNCTRRGRRIAELQEEIKLATAHYLHANRWKKLNAAAWLVHRQGLR
jgi:hypothetical protein